MKRSVNWSYRPYKPYFFNTGDIYICRLAPGKDYIHVEWLYDEGASYDLYYRKRGTDSYACIENITGGEYTLTALDTLVDYELYVALGDKKSRVRLAKTAEAVGVVVNYLHPEDDAYSYSGKALCSPSLVRLPDGALLASMDLYAPDAPQNLTLIYRSDDNGKTWHYQNELFPCYWGYMFIHKGELYMLSVSTEYGDLLIGKSTDYGKTFEAPTVIMRGSCSPGAAGTHRAPQNIFRYKDRLYTGCEWGAWKAGYHAAAVLSCDAEGDLLDASSWTLTEPIKFDPEWEGVEKAPSNGCMEGTVVLSPDGRLLNIMRYDMTMSEAKYGKILAFEIDTENPSAPLKYSHPIKFDGNHSKFMIKKDDISGDYFSIISRATDKAWPHDRRLLSLVRSSDLENWEVVLDIFDRRDCHPKEVGFQYVPFYFEGDDIIFLSRTAMNGARNYHDANYQTFHIIKNFRKDPVLY